MRTSAYCLTSLKNPSFKRTTSSRLLNTPPHSYKAPVVLPCALPKLRYSRLSRGYLVVKKKICETVPQMSSGVKCHRVLASNSQQKQASKARIADAILIMPVGAEEKTKIVPAAQSMRVYPRYAVSPSLYVVHGLPQPSRARGLRCVVF